MNKEFTNETKVGLGILAGVAVASGIGAAYLFSVHGREYRHTVRDWMGEMNQELKQRLKKYQNVDKKVYLDVIDTLVSEYQKMDEVDMEELASFAKVLKREYETLEREAEKGSKKKVSSGSSKSAKSSSGTKKSSSSRKRASSKKTSSSTK